VLFRSLTAIFVFLVTVPFPAIAQSSKLDSGGYKNSHQLIDGRRASLLFSDAAINAKRAAILSYITKLSSGPFIGTISGQNCFHGIEITDNSFPQGYKNLVENLHTQTGKWVGIIGVDYEYARLFTPDELSQANRVLIDYFQKGGLVTINLTPQNPWINDESDLIKNPGTWNGPGNTLDKNKVTSLNDLIDPSKPVYQAWMRKLDRVAAALLELKNAGVIVLWRPMQEMNGNWFWWGMSSHPNDPTPYINVIRQMHDYFTKTKHLNNLLWVYSPSSSQGQKNNSTWNRTVDWAYPGDDYVDIIAGTSYTDELNIDDYSTYITMGKPLGIAEYGPDLGSTGKFAANGTLDSRQILSRIKNDYPRIAYWVSWHQYPGQFWSIIGNKNYAELMNDPGVITRDDFPWK
jgi:mannan endo-1,4-beta-mannosidase